MKPNVSAIILSGLITTMASVPLFALGETTGRALQVPSGARQIGLGEAFTSVADDINTINYNPAGINNVTESESSFMFNRGLVDINIGQAAYGRKLANGSIGTSILYLDGGDIELNYSDRPSEKRKAQQDYVLTLCYGKERLWIFKKVGVNLKILQSTLMQDVGTTALAVDAGLLFKLFGNSRRPFTAGLAFQNIGPKVKYSGGLSSGNSEEYLPLIARAGISTDIKVKNEHSLKPSLDLIYSHYENSRQIKTGIEYSIQNKYFGRVGYRSWFSQQSGITPIQYDFTFGFGIYYGKYKFDYGAVFMGNLGYTHYLSFGMRMN